jgi:putative intracellular protease/amidase
MKTRFVLVFALLAFAGSAFAQNQASAGAAHKLSLPPGKESIRVAFVISEGAVVIDFAGPWEVFQDVMVPSRGERMEDQHPFELYTVSDTTAPLQASDGMRIIPDYSFDDAPVPKIVVIPAQGGRSPKMLAWVRKMTTQSDVVMSVCTGAFVLADAGLLNGKKATTHHGSYRRLQERFPQITVERQMRYVQSDPVIFTAGGLSSGIDLALHVVELYYGREAAQATADMMEYEGAGWKGSGEASKDFAVAPPDYPSDALTEAPLGKWQGVLASSEGTFHVTLHVWREKDGQLGGVVDSVDEGMYGMGLPSVRFESNQLSFEVPSVGGSYKGQLDPAAAAVTGTWTQRATSLPLVWKRAAGGGQPAGAAH